jgi:1-deoxy-D-xylulose-5-phosphate synthase
MVVMTPSDENECRQMLSTAYQHNGPSAVRYPRGGGPGVVTTADLNTVEIGKGEIRRHGKKIVILAFGSMLSPALEAAEKLNATVANMRFVKPLDTELIQILAAEHTLIVTIEENTVMGGAGAAVMEALQALSLDKPTLCLGLPDSFIEHGVHETMLAKCGLDVEGIIAAIEKKLT